MRFIYNPVRAYSQQCQDPAPATATTMVRKRWYMGDFEIFQKPAPTSKTYQLHYINSDAGLVGIVVEESGSYQYYAAYTDHLGSIVTLTNDAGVVVAKQSYDAWGRERNPDTWYYGATLSAGGSTTPTPPEWLYRGYTGHEMLPEYGLINMNGRLYDPLNGRMLRPDNYVQDPSNSQSFNRYSYCWNNPLKYTDPSGDYAVIDDIAAAVIGGIINWGSNGFQFNAEGLKYFGVGAAGGFVSLYATPVAGAALVGAGNAAISSYHATGRVDAGAVIKGAVVSGIVGGVTMGIGNAVAPTIGSTFAGISSPVLRNSLTQGAIGAGLGGATAFVMGGDVLEGAAWGLGTGLASGMYSGIRSARRDNVNPWTGESQVVEAYSRPNNDNGSVASGEYPSCELDYRLKQALKNREGISANTDVTATDAYNTLQRYVREGGIPFSEGTKPTPRGNIHWIEINNTTKYYFRPFSSDGRPTIDIKYNSKGLWKIGTNR